MTFGDLDASRIREHLETRRLGHSLHVVSETGSTNQDARAAAAKDCPDGHVIVADAQRAGRGSGGRDWSSPSGVDLYFSFVVRVDLPAPQVPPLTLAVGLGVANAIAEATGVDPQIKWPNDILVAGRKCGGILVETSSTRGHIESVVVGIGIGVNRERFEGELAQTATSLRLVTDRAHDRSVTLARVLREVERAMDRFFTNGLAKTAEDVDARLAWRGDLVEIDEVRGVLLGVAPNGALRVRTGQRIRQIVRGRLQRPQPPA